MSEQANTIYLKDYLEPAYDIESLDLTFELYENGALVRARQVINRRSGGKSEDLFLNGEDLELKSISLDGRLLTEEEYHLNDAGLLL